MDIIVNRPKPSVQDDFDGDLIPAPDVLRGESPAAGQSEAR